MLLTLHGTGGGAPNPDRLASAATATFSDGSIVLLDAGEGCSRALCRDRVDIGRISRVLVSHMHADHWCGLPGLVTAWSIAKRESPVDIHLPFGMIPFFQSVLLSSLSFSAKRPYTIHFHPLAPLSLPDGWSLSLFPTTHLDSVAELAAAEGMHARAYGYVLAKGDRRVVLSADLGVQEDLDGVINNAELVVCESTHVEPEEMLRFARERSVRRLLFTHLPPADAKFPDSFDGIEWGVASDGEKVKIEE
jgi:ribonuclease Z